MRVSKVKKANVESLALASNKNSIVVEKAFNRHDLIKALMEGVALDKKTAIAVLDTVQAIIVAHLVQEGPQCFKWPGLFSMKIKNKPATQARPGVNPFTREPTTFAAKPAKRLVKIIALNIGLWTNTSPCRTLISAI